MRIIICVGILKWDITVSSSETRKYYQMEIGIIKCRICLLVFHNWGFPGGTVVKESACQCRGHRRCGFYSLVGKIPWSRKCQPTPVYLPENPMNRGAWRIAVHGVTEESDTTEWLSNNKKCWIRANGLIFTFIIIRYLRPIWFMFEATEFLT